MSDPRHLLTIAGSDSGGGAGIQADLKTFLDHGVFGMSVVTAVTAQSPRRVTHVAPLSGESVRLQLQTVLADLPVHGIKIGMLANASIVAEVVAALGGLPSSVPVVLDPVMVSSSGARLLSREAEALVRDALLPLVTVATPNLAEVAVLAGDEAPETWAAMARTPILITGGDATTERLQDRLFVAGAVHQWTGPRVPGPSRHGTGCTLSSALAARLALGDDLVTACERAVRYTQRLVRHASGPQLLHGLISR